ncbi:hypothetical protein DFJ74DRAFT_763411 [Hyaloraphidium curvatum]|nr:hypothetical protein DFJ74DRAFT_763411 [Hyaloraphidium curvatum]
MLPVRVGVFRGVLARSLRAAWWRRPLRDPLCPNPCLRARPMPLNRQTAVRALLAALFAWPFVSPGPQPRGPALEVTPAPPGDADPCAGHGGATRLLPLGKWTRLRVAAGWACGGGSTFPLREGVRLFAGGLLGDAKVRAAHRLLLSPVPLAFSPLFDVEVSAEALCQAEAAAAWTAGDHTAEPSDVSGDAGVAGIAAALCGPYAGRTPPPDWPFEGSGGVLSLRRRCGADVDDTLAAVLGVPGFAAPNATELPCSIPMPYDAVVAHLTANLAALMDTEHPLPPGTARLHHPGPTRDAILRQVPVPATDPTVLILHEHGRELADAAGARDAAGIRTALFAGQPRNLPGVLTAYNVVVSPNGLMQAVGPALQRERARNEGDRPMPSDPARAYEQLLEDLYEPEPPTTTKLRAQRMAQHIENSLGGPDAATALRQRSPLVRHEHYWPVYAGKNLTEVPYADPGRGSVFYVTQLVMPVEGVDLSEQHAAVMDWDRNRTTGGQAPLLPVFDEVFLVVPAADNYYWFSTDFVGRTAPLRGYLADHPRAVVHVAPHFHRRWTSDDAPGFVKEWLRWLGIQERLVTGRVAARIAHALDNHIPGPRTHPLQLLALRSAMRSIAPEAFIAADREDRTRRVLVVDRSNATARGQNPHDRAHLLRELASRGLEAVLFTGSEPLPEAFFKWASVGAAVGPHGSGFTNALALHPGSTLAELVPAGHASLGWYYMQLAHLGGLRYHHVLVPGDLSSAVKGGVEELLWALCGDHAGRLGGCNSTAPPADGLNGLVPRNEGVGPKVETCLPDISVARHRLQASEPIHALRPLPGANLTLATRNGTAAGLVPWISLETALPLSEVRGITLLFATAGFRPDLVSRLPFHRGLIRALERRRLLPVAVPIGLLGPYAYQRFDDSCGNEDLHAAVASLAAVLDAVGKAGGDARAPVTSFGLSSGSTFTGIAAARVRLAGSLVQLDMPEAVVGHLVEGGEGRVQRDGECARVLAGVMRDAVGGGKVVPGERLPREDEVPDVLRPEVLPAFWMLGSEANFADFKAIRHLRKNLSDAGVPRDRVVSEAWMPSPLCPGTLADEAPWLLSRAASAAIVDTWHSMGLLVAGPEMDAALRTLGPACYNATPTADDCCTCPDGAAALHARTSWISQEPGGHLEDLVELFYRHAKGMLVFAQPGVPGKPLFFAGGGDPEFPAGSAARVLVEPRLDRLFAVLGDPKADAGLRGDPAAEETCRAAWEAWREMRWWLKMRVRTSAGMHEYTRGERFGEMAEWLAMWTERARAEGKAGRVGRKSL